MTTTPIGCERVERVAEYMLRSLPASERSAFETHVEGCPECRQELDALRPIGDTLVDWPTDILRPPASLWPRLAQRIEADGDGEASAVPEMHWIEEPGWKEVAPGISCKLLATDTATHRVSMLVRLAPGVAYPPHSHAGVEELHLLDGELWIDDRKLHPGDYNRGEPGTGDGRVWSETGCTCVLVTSFNDILR
ncbi:MAG TPA: cupin domain-containing protein [Kofleriaceae bacterium]